MRSLQSINFLFIFPVVVYAGLINLPPPLPGQIEPNLDLEYILDDDDNKTTKDPDQTLDRNYIFPSTRRWPGGVVPYTIDVSLSECTNVINEAIANIEAASCIDFVVRTTETAYINMHRDAGDTGCYASVGYFNPTTVRDLHLGPSCCSVGTVTHELLHSLGCFHEQTRPDRDNYVDVTWDKIESGKEYNFYKNAAEGTLPGPTICTSEMTATQLDMCVQDSESDTFGLSYDYDSIMHYSSGAFSIDDSSTLTSIVSGRSVPAKAQRSAMTTLDKYKLNAAYSCPGDYPKTCGGLLEGTSGTMVDTADTDCRWDIVAPRGSIIIVEFHTVDGTNDCVTVEELILGRSTPYCSGTAPTAYISEDNEVSVALTRSNPPGPFYATYRVFELSGTSCCHSLTFSQGGVTNYNSQGYASYHQGTYTKDGTTTTDPVFGIFPVYANAANNGLFLAHESQSPIYSHPWVIVYTPGNSAANTQFGSSTLSCPEDASNSLYADWTISNPALFDLPDYTLTCVTTCTNGDIPATISGYTIATDTTPTTFNHGDAIAYQKDDNTDCYIYSVCLKESGTWTALSETPGCPRDSGMTG